MVDVSVVIPARNAAGTLAQQLAALSRQEYSGDWEIVVADNGSTDGTRDIVRQWQEQLPRLRVVAVSEIGANQARNAGISATSGSRVLCCDADDEVSPTWVATLAHALDTADLAAGPLEYDRLNGPRTPRPRPSDHATASLPGIYGRPYGISANLGFRRTVFDTIRGFDESFGVAGEDVDFSWRAADAGFTLAFAPSAVVHYRLRPTLRALARQQFNYARGGAHVYAKHQALGTLPRRDLRQQLRSAAARVRDLLVGTTRTRTAAGRQALVFDAARFVGSVRGAVEYHVFV